MVLGFGYPAGSTVLYNNIKYKVEAVTKNGWHTLEDLKGKVRTTELKFIEFNPRKKSMSSLQRQLSPRKASPKRSSPIRPATSIPKSSPRKASSKRASTRKASPKRARSPKRKASQRIRKASPRKAKKNNNKDDIDYIMKKMFKPEPVQEVYEWSQEPKDYGPRKPAKYKKQIDVLLAKKFDPDNVNPTGWYMSEKIDGIRAYWDSKEGEFFSRKGFVIRCPTWFRNQMPTNIDLDGELWIDRKSFNQVSGTARKHNPDDEEWRDIKYMVFDVPIPKVPYERRVLMYKTIINNINSKLSDLFFPKVLVPVKIIAIKNSKHLNETLKKIESIGGEGLMIRKPGSFYENKRSSTLLKLKTFTDKEGTLIGYNKGEGRNANVVGALVLKLPNGTIITVGTGLTDEVRKNPPKIGAQITYKYFTEDENGVPRFPVYVGERFDI